jgi:hypothetical protein
MLGLSFEGFLLYDVKRVSQSDGHEIQAIPLHLHPFQPFAIVKFHHAKLVRTPNPPL